MNDDDQRALMYGSGGPMVPRGGALEDTARLIIRYQQEIRALSLVVVLPFSIYRALKWRREFKKLKDDVLELKQRRGNP